MYRLYWRTSDALYGESIIWKTYRESLARSETGGEYEKSCETLSFSFQVIMV